MAPKSWDKHKTVDTKHTNVPLQKNLYRNLRYIFLSPYTRNRAVRECCILPSRSFPYSRKGSNKSLRFRRILATALVSDFFSTLGVSSYPSNGSIYRHACAKFSPRQFLTYPSNIVTMNSNKLWVLPACKSNVFKNVFFYVVLPKTKSGFTLVLSLLVSSYPSNGSIYRHACAKFSPRQFLTYLSNIVTMNSNKLWVLPACNSNVFKIFFLCCSSQDEVWIYSCLVTISFRDKQRDWRTDTVNYIHGVCKHVGERISVT